MLFQKWKYINNDKYKYYNIYIVYRVIKLISNLYSSTSFRESFIKDSEFRKLIKEKVTEIHDSSVMLSSGKYSCLHL